ncbi:PASTA domain-containing protein [Nonomuraea dietziae]|uniref:PASTA domain-containing protein n=1 Tax=Nonomuraea dietziae TaxID=65515 RepID=UPI003407C750
MTSPMPPPVRRGFSGAVVSLIAILALGAGCFGGMVVGGAGSSSSSASADTPAPAPKAAETKVAEPEDTSLPAVDLDKPHYVKLPDFKGQNAAVAQQWLVDQGWDEFKNIELGSQDPYDTFVILPENWTVTKQSHKAGSRVKVGTTIVLTCTKDA